jgi:hypothetical protein
MKISRHPYLDSLGLVVNNRLQYMCCEWCQATVSPDRVQGHLKTPAHKNSKIRVQQEKLQEAMVKMHIAKDHPLPPCTTLDMQAPVSFQGLKVLEGFACTLCTQLANAESSLKDHYTRAHPTQKCPSTLIPCIMQRFSMAQIGPPRTLFRVVPSHSIQTPPIQSVSVTAQQEMAKVLQIPRQRMEVDPRSISPWLLTTKWHEHVLGYNVKELCDLVIYSPDAASASERQHRR